MAGTHSAGEKNLSDAATPNFGRRVFSLGFYLLPFAIALATCAFFVAVSGQNPLVAGAALINGAIGTPVRLAESLSKTIPLVMTGLAVCIAFRGGFWNIGAEGQFIIGAIAATGLATKSGCAWPIVLFGASVAGALWALLAAWLKFRRGAPEIITTIMLNYIALQVLAFSLQLPDQTSSGVKSGGGWLIEAARSQPQSDVFSPRAQLGAIVPDTTLHWGLLIALGCAVCLWWFLFRSEGGFVLRAAGANPIAAQASGIAAQSTLYRAVALSGALAGLGGALEISGATKQLGAGGFGYGYTAIAVALLGNLNPLGVLPAALLFGMLSAGGGAMERSANVPAVTVSIVIGVVIFAFAAMKLRARVN